MTLKSIILITIFLTVSVTGTLTQTTDKITPEEYIEANELSHKFEDKLLRSKDITPLLKEFFVDHFAERSLQVQKGRVGLLLDRSMIPASRQKEVRRYLIAEMNFVSRWFYYQSTLPESRANSGGPYGLFPSDVAKYLKSNHYWAFVLHQVDSDAESDKSYSEHEKEQLFDGTLHLLEAVNPMLLRSISNLSSGQKTRMRKNFEEIGVNIDEHQPIANNCDHQCFGSADGTRMVYVPSLFILLILVSQDGHLKILRLEMISM